MKTDSVTKTKKTIPLIGLLALFIVLPVFLWGAHDAKSASKKNQIFGSWEVSCSNSKGTVVEFTGSGDTAKGKIKELGGAGRFHYSQGEEVFRLKKSSGKWSGKFLWRNTDGVKRWQPASFTFVKGRLHGKTQNEQCYEYMKRAK